MNPKRDSDDIARTAARLARQVEIALQQVDLSLAQFRVLVQLAEGTVASSKLATQIAVSPPSITSIVEGHVQRGLVTRTHSDQDRRHVALELTAEGEAVLRNAERAVKDRLKGLAQEVGEPNYVPEAMNGLKIWRKALDAHRIARREKERVRTNHKEISVSK